MDKNSLKSGDCNNMGKCINTSVHTCYHCGNTGLLRYIETTSWKNEHIEEGSHGEIYGYTLIEHTDWHIFECPVCNQPVIISEYVFDVANDEPEFLIEFPKVPIHKEGVPKEITSAFESAVKTKGIDPAICLLSLRRVLEIICKEKGANGGTLEEKIKNLIDLQILPDMLDDACWVVRKLGNVAAHADKSILSVYEADQVIEYLSVIIEYLYSLPVRISKMKERIIEREKQK